MNIFFPTSLLLSLFSISNMAFADDLYKCGDTYSNKACGDDSRPLENVRAVSKAGGDVKVKDVRSSTAEPKCKQTGMPFNLDWNITDTELEATVSSLTLPSEGNLYDLRFCVGYENDLSDNDMFGDSGAKAWRDNCNDFLAYVKQDKGRIMKSVGKSLQDGEFTEVSSLVSNISIKRTPKIFILKVTETPRGAQRRTRSYTYVVKLDTKTPGRICYYDSPSLSYKLEINFSSVIHFPERNTLIGRGCISQGGSPCMDKALIALEFKEDVRDKFEGCKALMDKLPEADTGLPTNATPPVATGGPRLTVRTHGYLESLDRPHVPIFDKVECEFKAGEEARSGSR